MPPTKFLTLLNFDFLHGRPEWNGKWINYDEIAPHVWTCIGKCWKGVGIRTCRVILTFHLQHWPWRQSWQLIFQGMRKSCHQLIILQDRLLTLRDSCSFTQTHISRPFSWDQVTWTGTSMNCCRVVDLVKPPRVMPIDALELNCGSRFPKIPFVSECSPEKRSNYVARCLQHFATILSKQKQISLFMADQTYPHQHARRR